MKFAELDKKTQIRLSTIPQCVFVTVNPDDETPKQVMERQDKFLKLSEKIQDKLLSEQVSKKIQQIGEGYNLSLLQMASIARLIRNYYFGDIKEINFANILASEMKIDLQRAEKIVRYVLDTIIKNDELVDEISKIKLTLEQALEKYPKIKSQILTEKMINISGRPYPVKATISNWIKDYYSVVGAGNRDIMKRSNYLYNSKNTKFLSNEEKKKLATLIKSLDENSLVNINPEKEEIVFDARQNSQDNVIKKDTFLDNKKISTNSNSNKSFGGIKKNISKGAIVNFRNDFQNREKVSRDLKKNNKETIPEMKKPKITHIQGNDWNLKSDHFKKSKKKKRGIIKKIFNKRIQNNKNLDSRFENKKKIDSRIHFSSSQQLPIEKGNKNKIDEEYLPKFDKIGNKKNQKDGVKDNFFGKIGPIDE
ncbi:MAG TPA: hypothetical protein ENJ27_00385 [Candidatus Moranbacteria bacterium]|nr:hypothetical protein [Candidatus Moranbacteria bacterium]